MTMWCVYVMYVLFFFFKQKTAYEVRISDWSSDVCASDLLFVNSPDETNSQSEKEFTQSFIKQFGDINFIVKAILGAVFFTLLFLTGNTMMQSVRERKIGSASCRERVCQYV